MSNTSNPYRQPNPLSITAFIAQASLEKPDRLDLPERDKRPRIAPLPTFRGRPLIDSPACADPLSTRSPRAVSLFAERLSSRREADARSRRVAGIGSSAVVRCLGRCFWPNSRVRVAESHCFWEVSSELSRISLPYLFSIKKTSSLRVSYGSQLFWARTMEWYFFSVRCEIYALLDNMFGAWE